MERTGHHKNRMINIELLRLLAMMMVVSLHYLSKGGLLEELTGPLSAKGHLAWILESFSIAAVDVYVLISGYFLVETGFRSRRVISLVLQVVFYACLIPVALTAFKVPIGEITFYQLLQYIFPMNMLHYWFVSAYVLMFLFTPVLNAAVHAMKKKQLQIVIVMLLLVESLSKTVIPVRLELDNEGYDVYWFMAVYLIAAYIRLYGIPFLEKKEGERNKAALYYIGLSFAIYGWTMLIRAAFLVTGKFEDFMKSAYGYNHLLTIGAAVTLFYAFKNLEIKRGDSRFARFVCKVSPCSFGVYLLHEHINIRYEWPFWLGADKCYSALSLLGYWLTAIVIVMVVGLTVDYIRNLLFQGAGSILAGGKIDQALKKVDNKANGTA